jgi:hypothetical protein
MERTLPFVVAALVVAAVAIPMAGTAAVSAPAANTTQEANATDSTAPGERLAGVVGVQQAEFKGDVDRRAFGRQLDTAGTNASKAGVVAGQVTAITARLDSLQAQKATLAAARENGSLSAGKYRAQIARLTAQIETAQRLANQTAGASAGLPRSVLSAAGVNATAIQTLSERASELGGGEIAEIARDIAPGDRGQAEDSRADRQPARQTPTPPGETATTDERSDNATESTGAGGESSDSGRSG